MSTSDNVRTLPINMIGKASIRYFYFLVDFEKAEGLKVDSTSLNLKEGSDTDLVLELNCSYIGEPDSTKSKSYLLSYLTQIPSDQNLVEVAVNVGSNNKTGDVKKAKIRSLEEILDEDQPVDHPRLIVVKSSTTEELYIIVMAKTVISHSKTLSLTEEKSGENTNLKIEYNSPADNDPSQASGNNLVATNAISSTNGQYHKVYKKTDDEVSIPYGDPIIL